MEDKAVHEGHRVFREGSGTRRRVNASARIGLGMSRMEAGIPDRAIEELEAAATRWLGTGGTRRSSCWRTLTSAANEFGPALQVLSKLEPMQPNNTLIHNLKAAAFMWPGRNRAGRASGVRAGPANRSGLFPGSGQLWRSSTCRRVTQLLRANATTPFSRRTRNTLPSMLALADIASRTPGQEKEVLDWINRAKQASPGSPAPLLAELDYLRRTGQTDQARRRRPRTQGVAPEPIRTSYSSSARRCSPWVRRPTQLPSTTSGPRCSPIPLAQLQLAHAQIGGSVPAGRGEDPARRAPTQTGLSRRTDRSGGGRAEPRQRYDEATVVAKRVQYDLPQAPLGYVLEGDVLMATKQFVPAAALYEKALRARQESAGRNEALQRLSEAGKSEQGEAWLKDWLKEQPDDLTTRRTLAYAAMQRGKYPVAIDQYRQVLRARAKRYGRPQQHRPRSAQGQGRHGIGLCEAGVPTEARRPGDRRHARPDSG